MDDDVPKVTKGRGQRRGPPLLRAGLRHALFATYLVGVSLFLVFVILEIPALNRRVAPDLPYYTLRRTYQPDAVLVFTPAFRGAPHRMTFRYRGDLYDDDFGTPVEPIAVDVTYDASGFRSNRSKPPYEIAVIGDSYVDLSETDDDSFSEHLARRSGRSTINLGTAWYGPYQYVEVLARTAAAPQPPRYALFMFYAGNDIADIEEYERWRAGGRYYGQDRRYWDASLPRRFILVAGQTLARIRPELFARTARRQAGREGQARAATHPDLAFVRLGDTIVPMALSGPSPEAPADSLLARPAWRTLRTLIDEFRRHSIERGITPVLVHLPTKWQTYAAFVDASSGSAIRDGLAAQRTFAAAQADALATLAGGLGICFVDLLPRFRSLAANGELLYHPFDTHWNDRGRAVGAQVVAEALSGACRHGA